MKLRVILEGKEAEDYLRTKEQQAQIIETTERDRVLDWWLLRLSTFAIIALMLMLAFYVPKTLV